MYIFLLITFPMLMQLRIGPNMLAFCFNYSPTTCNNIKESPFELGWLHDQNFLLCVVSIFTGLFLIGLILKSVTLRQAVVAVLLLIWPLLFTVGPHRSLGTTEIKSDLKKYYTSLQEMAVSACWPSIAEDYLIPLFKVIESLPKLRSRLGSQYS